MKHRLYLNLRRITLGLIATMMLVACVTETNDRLAQNRDPEKAAKTYVKVGMRYMQGRQMGSANRALKRAEELAPEDPAVNNALALFYKMEGEDDEAERYFKKAFKFDPGFSQARNNYAVFLFGQDRFKEAIQQLEIVTKDFRYSRRYTAFENLGVCYLRLNDVESAKKAFNRSLQLNPSQATSLFEMAEISFNEGDHAVSIRYLKKYESVAKPSPRQLWLGIQLQREQGDRDKVASYELALKNMFPKSEEYQALKASKVQK